jgi:sugar/nucleoside kinase (ribokinase family)
LVAVGNAERPWPLLVAGTITRDDVRTPLGFNPDGLGGSATYFSLAARLFSTVNVIATAGLDFIGAFKAAMPPQGVNLRGVVESKEPTYRWFATHDYNTGTTSEERSDQGAYRNFEPRLGEDQRKTPIVFLGSMQPRYQLRVLEQLTEPWLVAGDTMRLYIREQRKELEPVLKRLDYLFLNGVEAMALAEASSVAEAATALAKSYQLRGLLIKEGPQGATLYLTGQQIHLPALPVDPPVDPTGAGDAVAGGFLGCLAEQKREDPQTLKLALAYAMVLASFTIQHFSVGGLQHLTRAEVEARMASMAWGSPVYPATTPG